MTYLTKRVLFIYSLFVYIYVYIYVLYQIQLINPKDSSIKARDSLLRYQTQAGFDFCSTGI